jgi:hypothetical protein
MKFAFDCDCTYESRTRVFLMSIRENGAYWAKDGQLFFSRASGQITAWPFRFEADRLILEEASSESRTYQRTERRQCPNASGPS